jgi:UDP-N-acetylglucosamine 2-epimerase
MRRKRTKKMEKTSKVYKMKVMTIIGTRPEIIRLSETIKKLDKYTEHILVHTGQNYDYELNEVFFKDLGLRKPDYFLGVVGNTLGETLGNVMSKSEEVMLKEKPDALLILGDTNSGLSAIVAKRLKIPIFHLEAGNRCFDERVPEEVNRKIIDVISDVNIVYTPLQRDYLIQEGKPMDRIFISGSPMNEVLSFIEDKISDSNVLEELNLERNKYFLVSYHREENTTEDKIYQFIGFLMHLYDKYKLPVIVSTHPRTRKAIESAGINILSMDGISFSKPFGFVDYLRLQKDALCVISDSGTVAEESSILWFKAITIRDAMERPESINHGNITMCTLKNALDTLDIVIQQDNIENKIPNAYLVYDFSWRVLNIILSYTDYINKRVWFK